MGPGGSGKSTLMHGCAALDRADSGSVQIGEHQLSGMNDKALTRLRRAEIGFVFQSFNLVPTLTAEANITLPISIAGKKPDRASFAPVLATLDPGSPPPHKPTQPPAGPNQPVPLP